jgi:hypothetical protein
MSRKWDPFEQAEQPMALAFLLEGINIWQVGQSQREKNG